MADPPSIPPRTRSVLPPLPAPPRIPRPPPIPGPHRIPPPARIPPAVARVFKPLAPVQRQPRILTPAELERFKNILVFARSTVEGYFAGKHRSPFRGSSVEFADYKEYV